MRPVYFSTVCLALVASGCAENQATGPEAAGRGSERPSMSVAAAVGCGEQITTDVTVENDLSCAGDALVVAADGVTLNLNGHTISGNGTGVGITVRARAEVTIKGGTVRNFVTGILIAQSSVVTVKDNGLTQNREGVFFNGSSGGVVKENLAWQNTLRGIMIRPTGSGVISTDNQIVDNVLTDNPSGILLFGQPGNTFKGNSISGSAVAGFDLTGGGATGNVFKENLLTANAAGIKFGVGYSDNSFIGNSLTANTCGLQGTSAGNLFKDNVLSGNGVDTCP